MTRPSLRAVAWALVALPALALAGERTTTLSSFDFSRDNPFDASVETSYHYQFDQAYLDREKVCTAGTQGINGGTLCSTNDVLLVKELKYSRAVQWLDLTPRVALWHDLDAFVTIPIFLSDQTSYRYQPGVSPDTTSVDAKNGQFLFHVPYDGPKRAGVGDVRFGLRWEPFNQDRDPDEADWRIVSELTVPSAAVRRGGNTAVGEGLVQWRLQTSLSRRFFGMIEPYFEAYGHLLFPGSSSLFERYGSTQSLVNPGHRLGINLGLEIVPWERPAANRRVSFDVGLGSDYRFEGRAYSELFEALAASPCGGADAPSCTATTPKGGAGAFTGLTDISHYGSFRTWIGLNVDVIEYVQFKVGYDFQYDKSHYLTNADAGTGGVVSTDASYSPVYNPSYDEVGKRFLIDASSHHQISIGLTLKY
jgi:hypothetical protein